ncbi:cysteine--tRNA ligase [Candidatus Kaiserbacteria bacterium]|nr:cysteine--tRNA ligase [Candidatus Kaiserbacteria bacterium]
MFSFFRKKPRTDAPLSLFNTETRRKDIFTARKNREVTMYTCGNTVYDYAHIGNLSSFLMPDILRRVLREHGYEVKHTINFTDFGHLTDDGDAGEDKMMKALKREGKAVTLSAMRDVADVYINAFKEDMDALNMLTPTTYARASDYVREQIALVKTLLDKGYAYETSDGVYFEVSKFPTYGRLGNVDINKIREGARVEANPEKHHPADFALWKKGMLGWDSDWGKGFPGWHIECTAMIFSTLGKQIDIHTGGEDLQHTHHNGEIAQAEAITKKKYVNYWLHTAFITIDNKKFAKSEGNGITLRHLMDKGYTPDTYRYWLLSRHYRTQANFSFEALDGAKQALFRLKRHFFEEYLPKAKERGDVRVVYWNRFMDALNDDLDTPKALAVLWNLIKDTEVPVEDKVATLLRMDSILGIGLSDTPDKARRELGIINVEDIPQDVQELMTKREEARKKKDWDEADRLREELNMKGYSVEDTPEGAKVVKV